MGTILFISSDYTTIISAHRNTVGISHKGENIRLARLGFKSASEVNCHGIIFCRQIDRNVLNQLAVSSVIIFLLTVSLTALISSCCKFVGAIDRPIWGDELDENH